MTSTVLDVGVFLLCVGASVATIIAGVPVQDLEENRSPSDAVADRIATETATVTYTVDDEKRRFHATLSAHLVTAAQIPSSGNTDDSSVEMASERYTDVVETTVERRLDPRTELVVAVLSDAGQTRMAIGAEPPTNARVHVSVVGIPIDGEDDRGEIIVRRWDRETR